MLLDAEAEPTHSRKKDRLSYSRHPFQVDLTQVKNLGGHQDGSLVHELEVEFSETAEFISELRKGKISGHSQKAYAFTEAFLNNMRVLARHQDAPAPSASF